MIDNLEIKAHPLMKTMYQTHRDQEEVAPLTLLTKQETMMRR